MFFRKEYVVRPNRTIEAREELAKTVSFCLKVTIIVQVILSPLIYIGLSTIFYKQSIIFEGCPDSNANYKQPVYWLRVIATFTISCVHAVDGFFALVGGIWGTALVSGDLLIYWRHNHNCSAGLIRKLVSNESRLCSAKNVSLETKLECYSRFECRRLQENLCDFFACVRRANNSIALPTHSILFFWLCCITLTAAIGFKSATNLEFVRIVGLLLFIIMSLVCCLSLRLKRRVQPSYPILCSLTALEQNGAIKQQWLTILEYYWPMKMYAFTLFGNQVFTELTCLRIISYTLTIVAVVETSWRRSYVGFN